VQAAVGIPSLWRAGGESSHQDVVDSCRCGPGKAPLGLAEVCERPRRADADVEVAAEQDGLSRRGEPVDEHGSPQELGIRHSLVRGIARGVQVSNHERPVGTPDSDGLADTPLARPRKTRNDPQAQLLRLSTTEPRRIEHDVAVVDHGQFRTKKNRVCLTRERRAHQAVVEVGEETTEPGVRRDRPQHRPLRDVRDHGHPAPAAKEAKCPDRQLLQAEDIGTVRAREPHHLFEKRPAPGRLRVPVEEVPGPDKQALYCTGHMRLRRERFADVIDRQLALFEREHRGLIDDCVAAERAYDRAARDEAEERYGDYVDLVETGTELLADLRDNFASTLDEDGGAEYEDAFNQAVLRRLRRFALEIEDR
jgi:hypothetical protein